MTPEEKKHIYGSLKNHSISLARILQILQSDDSVDEIGLVKEVHINTKAIAIMKKNEAVKTGQNVVYGMIGAVAIFIFYAIIRALINKFLK